MNPPLGQEHPPNNLSLRGAYDLKKTPRAWFSKFNSVISQQDFTPSSYDSTLFVRTNDARIILLLLYVDDMIIMGNDVDE